MSSFESMSEGSVENSLGVLFITCAINFYLLGCVYSQVWQYYTKWEKDHVALKIFVGLVVIVDTGASVNLVLAAWDYLIDNFGDYPGALIANRSIVAGPAIIGISSFLPQLFLIFRVWLYSQFRWAVFLLLALSISSLCCSCLAVHVISLNPAFSEFYRAEGIVTAWLATGAAGDILITLFLLDAFKKHKTGFSKDEIMLNKFIRISFTTGGMTALSSLICLVLFVAQAHSVDLGLFFFLPSWMISKLYCLSVLVILLSRPTEEAFIFPDEPFRFSTSATEEDTTFSHQTQTSTSANQLTSLSCRRKSTFKESLLKKSFNLRFNNMIRPDVNSIHIDDTTDERTEDISDLERAHSQSSQSFALHKGSSFGGRDRVESFGTSSEEPCEEKKEEIMTETRSDSPLERDLYFRR